MDHRIKSGGDEKVPLFDIVDWRTSAPSSEALPTDHGPYGVR
jgi:hypothetical protein